MVQFLKLIKVKALFQLMLMMKKKSKEELKLQKKCKSRKEELKLQKNYKSSFVMTKMKKQCHCKFSNKLSIHSKISLKKLVKWMTMSFKKWSLINSKIWWSSFNKYLISNSLKKIMKLEFIIQEQHCLRNW